MDTIIVSSSRSRHGNTARVADAIAEVLHARVITPADASADVLLAARRVGFGSGIYYQAFDRALRDCVRSLPDMGGRQAFAFATSGFAETPLRRYTTRFTGELTRAGFAVAGTFLCRGRDTWGPAKLIGGVGKGRPDDDDLREARAFAARLGH